MNYFIQQTTILPSTAILSEDAIKQLSWYGFSENTTLEEITSAGYTLLPELTTEQPADTVMVADKDESGTWVSVWMSSADYEELLNTRMQATAIRARRDLLLSKSDWTQSKDIPENISAAWVTYRQALRDITLQEQFPLAVTWPQLPN